MRGHRLRSEEPKRRPHRLPPPLKIGAETYDAEPFLQEIPGELGPVLWKTAQSIELWASAPPSVRPELFSPDAFANRLNHISAAGVDPKLLESLVITGDVLRGVGNSRAVAAAAVALSDWSRNQNAPRTAVALMQAAAMAAPDDAELALEVGRLARAAGDVPRAETWFRHAVMVSRASQSWDSYAVAYLAVASILASRGSLPSARRSAVRALRAAQRHALREVQGRAHHDLMQIALLAGKEKVATMHGRLALESYGHDHPRLAALANDVAYHWILKGFFRAALRVLLALRGAFEKPWEELFLLANIVRASAGAREVEVFENAWQGAIELLEDARTRAWAPAALMDLARGALQRGEIDRARWAAVAAVEGAKLQGQHQVEFEAEALLQEAAGEDAAARQMRADEPGVRVPSYVNAFSRELVSQLQPTAGSSAAG